MKEKVKMKIPRCAIPSDQKAQGALRTDYPKTQRRSTGIIKRCPSCARVGWVFLTPMNEAVLFTIVWSGPSNVLPALHIAPDRPGQPDYEMGVSPAELFDPNFGCGNCGPDFE